MSKAQTEPDPFLQAPRKRFIKLGIAVAIGVALWCLPCPADIPREAWHLFALFVATIVGIMLAPYSMGAMAVFGIAATTLTGTLTINEALSGFSNRVLWLVLIAFFIARSFIKTGLGKRIAYGFVALLGRRTLGLSYGLIATDLLLAPFIPSITARCGAVIYPIVRSTAETYDSRPADGTARRIGAFLTLTCFQATLVTSAMFLTAMAANPVAAQLAGDAGIEITWADWAVAALVPGLISLLVVPFVIYKLYPPQVKKTPEAASMAREKLAAMGTMKRDEWIAMCTFTVLLLLWIFGRSLGIHSTTAAFGGLSVLLATRVLTWDDVLREKGAWDTFLWLSTLVMMASFLNKLGFIPWFSEYTSGLFSGMGWVSAFLVLCLIYFYSHYFFASMTAHITSMYAAFLGVALAVGAPPVLAALVLAFFSNLYAGMTHYGCGPAPVLFGTGYIPIATWWRLGALISVVNLLIWFVLGGWWWKILGLW